MKKHLWFRNICAIVSVLVLTLGLVNVPLMEVDAKNETVSVAYFESDGFQEGAEDGAVKSGYSYEILQEISKYTGWNYKYVYGSWPELYDKFLKGEIDLFPSLSKTDERLDLMEYPDYEMDTEYTSIFVRADDTSMNAEDLTSLNGKRLSVINNNKMTDDALAWLDEKGLKPELVYYDDLNQPLSDLEAGKIDAFTGSEGNIEGTHNVRQLVRYAEGDIYIAVRKGDYETLDQINDAMKKISENNPDFYDVLDRKYYGNSTTNSSLTKEETNWVSKHKVLKMGYVDDYLPYSDTQSDGEVVGLVKDYMDQWLISLGLTDDLTIEYVPYKTDSDMYQGLIRGETDVLFPVPDNDWYTEDSGIMTSDVVVNIPVVAVFKGDYSEKVLDNIAINTDHSLQDVYQKSYLPNSHTVTVNTTERSLNAVLDGIVTSTIMSSYRVTLIGSDAKYDSLRIIPLEHGVSYSFGLRKGDAVLMSLVNRGVSLVDSSLVNSTLNRYASGDREYTFLDFVREHALPILSGIVILAGGIIWILYKYLKYSEESKRLLDEQAAKLEVALEQADQASRAKTTFLFNMSHDIRTPLNAIIGFAELEEKTDADPAKQKEYRKNIVRASHQLLGILNNVLEMARIESNKLEISEELVDVVEFTSSILTIFDGQIAEKKLTLTTERNITHQYMYLDETHLSEIMMNLISNSIKYTPEGGNIYISFQELPGSQEGECLVETKIRDDGIGMSEEFVNKIFEEFSRERNASQSGIQGTGLGMAIVKQLIDLMHGTIHIASQVGQGTEITIRIPLRVGHAPALETEKAEAGNSMDFSGRRILMAEDMDVNAMLANEILKMHGFVVDRAKDGVECVDMLSKSEAGYYDLILMDIQMPNMNGYDATEHIRNMGDSLKANIPIIALSANAFKEDVDKSLKAGMNGHIAKPLEVDKMLETISGLLH